MDQEHCFYERVVGADCDPDVGCLFGCNMVFLSRYRWSKASMDRDVAAIRRLGDFMLLPIGAHAQADGTEIASQYDRRACRQ